MTFVAEIYKDGDWQDINDYVIIGAVPYYERNIDWSPVSTTLKIQISNTVPYNITWEDKIRLTIDGVFIYGGYVIDPGYNYGTHYHDVTLEQRLYKLRELNISHPTLSPILEIGNGNSVVPYKWNSNSWYHLPILSYLWTLQGCFIAAGLTLDTSLVQEKEYRWTYRFHEEGAFSAKIVKFKDLVIDRNMLYCLNQNIATRFEKIEGEEYSFKKYRIKIWDFVQLSMQLLGLGIFQIGIDDFQLVPGVSDGLVDNKNNYPVTKYSIIDNDIYAFRSQHFISEEFGYDHSTAVADYLINVGSTEDPEHIIIAKSRQYYSDNTKETPLWFFHYTNELEGSTSDFTTASIMNNFAILAYRPTTIPGTDVDTIFYNKFKYGLNEFYHWHTTKNYVREEITSKIQLTKKAVLSHKIDFTKRVSIIKQVEFTL
ncbi:MAG: hypothetical protein GY853_09590 [PVC group bacterium]|nr:hypothetical protein [PVC group bacterium]